MPATVVRTVLARITAHGLNVYPLEGFGLLLGQVDPETQPTFVTALPVGKTERWYEPSGRFSGVLEASERARTLYAQLGLAPIGLYCTSYSSFGGHSQTIVDSAPMNHELPWLLVRFVDGGDTIFGYSVYAMAEDGKRTERRAVIRPRVPPGSYNPRRLRSLWNREWGILNYGNLNEIERPRLGLP